MIYKFLANAKYNGKYYLAGDEIELGATNSLLEDGLVKLIDSKVPVIDTKADKADIKKSKKGTTDKKPKK